ncbi:MAG: phytanoyl-CoA hydroxylase [Candidatus Promineifilaceae bacterium]|jgi:phytanoyl-CoA hydroxylase
MSKPTQQDLTVDVDGYQKDGYVMARGLFSQEEALRIKDACKAAVESRSETGSGVHVFQGTGLNDILKQTVCDARLVRVIEQLYQSRVEFLSVKPVYKSAALSFASPWHQDWQYWKGVPKLSVWIALDPATVANGCLKVIPGSHLKSWAHDTSDDDKGFGNRISEAALADETIIDAVMEAGDALFFHDLLLHASHPNESGNDRWSMIPTYRDACVPDPDSADVWSDPVQL